MAVDDVPDDAPPPVDDEVLVRLDPSWIRYAPLTVTGLASAAAIVGFASQGFSRFSQERSVFRDGATFVSRLAWWVDVLLLLGVVSLLAVGAYVLTFWGFRLTRNRLGTLHTRRGLLTNRETSIDAARVRGDPARRAARAPSRRRAAVSRSSRRVCSASRVGPTGCARPRRPAS